MNLERFLIERSPDWSELDALLGRSGVTGSALRPAELLRLAALYRSAAADLATARRSFPDTEGAVRLQALVASAHGIVYGHAQRQETVGQFFSRGLWRQIHRSGRSVGIAVAVTLGAVALGAVWALTEPTAAVGLLPGGAHARGGGFRGAFYGISVTARGGLAAAIFTNNIEVAFFAVAGGLTFGVLTVYSLVYNGALLGVLGVLEWRAGGFGSFVRLVVPHGLLELSCIALAGGAGIEIARALIDPGRHTRAQALGRLVPVVGACTLGTVVFLVVAGLTEGFITPWDLPVVPAVALGAALAGTFWALVAVRGRDPGPSPPPPSYARPILQPEIALHAG